MLKSGETIIDVIEIEPQTLWNYKRDAHQPYVLSKQTLQHLQSLPQPKIVHSVGFAVGGTHRPCRIFAEALSNTISALDAAWASEHLSFTHVGSNKQTYHTGFMLPSLQTIEGVDIAAQTIRDLDSLLPVPFAVETAVNYLKPRKGELTDGEFVALTVEKADCGILLDIHNIWTNEKNGRQKTKDFLSTIPLDRVWEIHLGGGFEFDGYWLDAHSGVVPEPVLKLMEELIPALPNLRAVIYEIFPSFVPLFGLDAIQKQLEEIKTIWERTSNRQQTISCPQILYNPPVEIKKPQLTQISPYLWEKTLGELVTNGKPEGLLAKELEKDNSIPLVRKLIWKFRAGAIVKALSTLTKLILLHSGDKYLETLLGDYFERTKPEPFASEEAKGFLEYLRHHKPGIPYLQDILSYEEGAMNALIEGKTQYVRFSSDPRDLLQALANGNIPENLNTGSYELEIPSEWNVTETSPVIDQ